MSLQSKKNLVKIQPNKKSVKSSLPRRLKANKSRSKTQLKSKRSLRATSKRPTVSKKKLLKQSGGNLISFDKFQELINIKVFKDLFTYIMEDEKMHNYFSGVGSKDDGWLTKVSIYLNPIVQGDRYRLNALNIVKDLHLFYPSLQNTEPLSPMNFNELNSILLANKDTSQKIEYHKQFIIIILINIIGNPIFAKYINAYEEYEPKIKQLKELKEEYTKIFYYEDIAKSIGEYVELLAAEAAPAVAKVLEAKEAAPAEASVLGGISRSDSNASVFSDAPTVSALVASSAPAASAPAAAAEVLAASNTESFLESLKRTEYIVVNLDIFDTKIRELQQEVTDTEPQDSDNLNSNGDKITFCKELLSDSLISVVENIEEYRTEYQINLVIILGLSLYNYLKFFSVINTNKIAIAREFKKYIVNKSLRVRREQMIVDDSKFYVTD